MLMLMLLLQSGQGSVLVHQQQGMRRDVSPFVGQDGPECLAKVLNADKAL